MITVIGSLNMDLVVTTDDLPKQGETKFGRHFATLPGGKGANQAVAAAKLGAKVQMIGCVGDDLFGQQLRAALQSENVKVEHVRQIAGVPTGVANILLTKGDNRIIVVRGANDKLSTKMIEDLQATILQSKIVIVQLEIPASTVQKVLEICHAHHIPVVLNPAPAAFFRMEWMDLAAYVTPNESECEEIFGSNGEHVLQRYPNQLIVTLGDQGAQFFDRQNLVHVPSFHANVKDTTGAGDTFNGAFAYAIGKNLTIEKAVLFANAAASLSVESFGAQSGMPNLEAVQKRLASTHPDKGDM